MRPAAPADSESPGSGKVGAMSSRHRAAARRLLLHTLVSEQRAKSQDELRELLAQQGHPVTQTTVSRDLTALGIRKTRDREGRERYRLPRDRETLDGRRLELADRLQDFAATIGASGNMVVIRTSPGAAGTVAAALDAAHLENVLGSVAGDDTVLIVSAAPDGGSAVASNLTRILEESPR